jgi:hypothetical protein
MAGYKPNRSHASRLVAKGNIRGRVAELQGAAAAETQITIERLIKEAADIQKRATKAGQHSAAIAALIAKAKLAGRWVDRSQQKTPMCITLFPTSRCPMKNGLRSTSLSIEKSFVIIIISNRDIALGAGVISSP